MVLTELGQAITRALHKLRAASIVDQAAIDDLIKELCNALLTADVNFSLVRQLQASVKKKLDIAQIARGMDRTRVAQQVIVEELRKILDPGVAPFKPLRHRANVVVLVGLQGAGKTTTATKIALYYGNRGFRPALVCADTFRAGAFDQLAQNATRAKIPFYGSHTESDPVAVAADGVNTFKAAGCNLIIVDTSGRHKQEADLFDEMRQICNAVQPDLTIFVMDASIGQAAVDQARAFGDRVDVGAVVVTKLDGHSKGGGALSAIASTKSPILFVGTGEGLDDLREFDAASFVSRLLGLGDTKGFANAIKDTLAHGEKPALLQRVQAGKHTLRDMYEWFDMMQKTGYVAQMLDALPDSEFKQAIGRGGGGASESAKTKRLMVIMDSMTNAELDGAKPLTTSRIARIARGSGTSVREVNALLQQHKLFEKIVGQTKSFRPGRSNIQQLQALIPPQVMSQLGGASGLASLMRRTGNNSQ